MNKDDIKYIGSARIDAKGCKGCDRQPLSSYDWLVGYSDDIHHNKYVEVQFKNTRKVVFTNPLGLELHKDDLVAVEGSPGVDIGRVVLTGTLAALRFKRQEAYSREPVRQVFRLATPNDLDRCAEAKRREHGTMIEARQIAEDLGLEMKIGDVEYQGDGSKAIFYYIADGRVDFRRLIRVLAETFHVRIEMKQIGARQEAGRIGGIGPCGRPLCCAQWMTNFKSVNTAAARYQELTLNPEKLTGQCAKLKCCTNFEVNTYVEAQKRMPSRDVVLETEEGSFFFFKWDLLKGEVSYTPEKNKTADMRTISTRRVREIIEMNHRGEKPATLLEERYVQKSVSKDILDENVLTRFDDRGRKRRKGNASKGRKTDANRPKNSSEEEGRQTPMAQASAEEPQKAEGGNGNRRRPGNDRRNTPRNGQRGGQAPREQGGTSSATTDTNRREMRPQRRNADPEATDSASIQPRNVRRDRRSPREGNRPQGEGKGPKQTPTSSDPIA